jgi:hypothetical protein
MDLSPGDGDKADDDDVEDLADLGTRPVTQPTPYIHDPARVNLAAALLDRLVADHGQLHSVEGDLITQAEANGVASDDPLLGELRCILWYRLRVARDGAAAGADLVPLADDGGASWPRPIRLAPDEVRALWAELSGRVTHPVSVARLNDLCFSAGIGNGRTAATVATRAYLEWPLTSLDTLYVAAGLARAWTLSRSISDAVLEADVYDRLRTYAAAQLAAEGNPGTIFPLLEALTRSPRKAAPLAGEPSAAQLVDEARARFQDSYLVVRLTAMMRRLSTDPESTSVANRAEVQAHLDEAKQAEHGAVKMHHFEAAAAAARRLNVRDLEAEAVTALQSLTPEDLGLARITAHSSIPAYIPEAFLRDFDESHDWREALHRFLHTDSPTGSYERNLASARRELARPSLRNLFPTKRLGGHGLPQQTVHGDGARIDEELTRFELLHSATYGHWYAEALDRIAATFGTPNQDELRAFLVDAYRCDAGIACAFAESLHLFWEGRRSAAVHLAVPKIEGAVRSLLLELDEAIYRVEAGKSIGQFPGLGFMLPQLVKNGFDPDWERFLGTMLLPRGENLRNLLAHGFVDDIAPYRAALVLRALGLMMLLTSPDREKRDAEVIRCVLERPTGSPTPTSFRRRCRRALVRSIALAMSRARWRMPTGMTSDRRGP